MKLLPKTIFFFSVIILCACIGASCAGQNRAVPYIIPEQENEILPDKVIETENIIETQDGYGASNIPKWLSAYIYGGIEEVEESDISRDRYYFISRNESLNINALGKWANNYSPAKDFPRLASSRIEERMISAATMYPDNDYGFFFETLVKKALGSEYPAAVKEDTYWIKTRSSQENDNEVYEFFVILSIDKAALQTHISNMMAEVLAVIKPTRAQNAAIKSLQQTFFEGF